MPMTKARMEEHLNKQQFELSQNRREINELKDRLKVVAAENETLRMDKKWLQQVVQGLIAGRNNIGAKPDALPR